VSEAARPNRLIHETSPYLLQHAHNPVDWYPWGDDALGLARTTDKPILLSVGYSACHWCHVMEHESFENPQIAAFMNEHFVPIKVDREERPDIDEIYMNAVQIMTGSGGWPMTVFLTPELEPFYGGTYFPPEDKSGRPGFLTVMTELKRAFSTDRERINEAAAELTKRLRSLAVTSASREVIAKEVIHRAVGELSARFDSAEGGFSGAPKFPPSGTLSLLLRHYRASRDKSALDMVELTLDKMASGGLYDQLGGGFHRYATDERWLAPHFEKMLYDNALLVPVYLEAYQITGKEHYARIARETLSWVIREMQGAEGGYYSSQDADSEGVEGKFYVWSKDEIEHLLGDEHESFCAAYDVTRGGNWEGANILHLPHGLSSWSASAAASREKLRTAREARIHPGLDDKVLTSWNGLMLVAMAQGYRILGDREFLDSARRAARFIGETLYDGPRLLATYRDGHAKHNGYLDDHAFLLAGYIELFACDFDPSWLERAGSVADALTRLFRDEDKGGFFFTGKDHEALLMRTKTGYDGAIPSGNGMAATTLLRLAALSGDDSMETLALDAVRAFYAQLEQAPSGFAQLLHGVDFHLAEKRELVVAGDAKAPEVRAALERLWSVYAPHVTIVGVDPALASAAIPLLTGKTAGPDPAKPRFYLCEGYQCQAPTDDLEQVIGALGGLLLE